MHTTSVAEDSSQQAGDMQELILLLYLKYKDSN